MSYRRSGIDRRRSIVPMSPYRRMYHRRKGDVNAVIPGDAAKKEADAGDGLVERLRELADLRYQSHTLHVPAALIRAADTIAALQKILIARQHELITRNSELGIARIELAAKTAECETLRMKLTEWESAAPSFVVSSAAISAGKK